MYLQPADGAEPAPSGMRIAVVGSGISGLSAAWLLSQRHEVTLYEAEERLGGHSHTRMVAGVPVDTGFIVFNHFTYPNLTALLRHLKIETLETAMTFAVSLDRGRLEYSGTDMGGLLAQRRNMLRPRFWSMMRDLLRFYREAPRDLAWLGEESLHDYLEAGRYGAAFRDDHLYPMAAAIWSTPCAAIRDYPAASFIRFCENHYLLEPGDRPAWQTVAGGAREYVAALSAPFAARIRTGTRVRAIRRDAAGVDVASDGDVSRFDQVVIASHADEALAMLADADAEERHLLGAFRYTTNTAVLHGDAALMPQRRRVWSAWNCLAERAHPDRLSVTYWMNALQHLPADNPLFVTLNPIFEPDPALVHWRGTYCHPVFDGAAMRAQRGLWALQGRRRAWFCGAHFGSGFHEDGLQAGLAVAEQLGGLRRPWTVAAASGRIAGPAPARVAAR
ncbi:MAG: FAD-dependent oxidoreductase [Sphingomonadales bacterium]|nr:FAD-dependent oxidoreductase [Sphingomonadales bacterium]